MHSILSNFEQYFNSHVRSRTKWCQNNDFYFAIEGVDLYHSRYSQNHPNSKTSKLIRNWDFKQIVVATAWKKVKKKRYEFGVWDEHWDKTKLE